MGRLQQRREVEHRQGERERRQDRHRALNRRIRHDDRGSGFISTTVGVFTFLIFLLVAVQLAYNLYATTMVTSAANDAARRLAGAAAEGDTDASGRAEAWVRELLGGYGDEHVEQVVVRRSVDVVTVRVVAANPGLLPPAFRRPIGLDRIDRTARVRVEREIP